MRWFRVPTFSGIEAAADDADRGTLRLAEGCLPVGPGGLHSGPVWETIGTVDNLSQNVNNLLTATNDAVGNSILFASRNGQVHDMRVFPVANTELQSTIPCYSVSMSSTYNSRRAYFSAVGNRLVAFGDGTSEAVFAGQGAPVAGQTPTIESSSTVPDAQIYHLEYSKFPDCRFFVIGPNKTLFAGGDPANPLVIYISEPAGLTQPDRDSLYSLEATSNVNLLMTDASEVTALSCVAGNVAAHTDAGIFLLSPPLPDQANTGYRVEQAPTSSASAAVNLQVVAGEDGTQPYYLGFDGQIWRDPQGSGCEQKATYADPIQASATAKGRWDSEHPTDLGGSFATYEPESGQYWVYIASDSDAWEEHQASPDGDEPTSVQAPRGITAVDAPIVVAPTGGQAPNGITAIEAIPTGDQAPSGIIAAETTAAYALYMAGFNGYGQFGNGTNTDSLTLLQILSSGVDHVTAGSDHTLFIKSDGSLHAMGKNTYGQLGDGTTTSRNSPVELLASGVAQIAANMNHSLFVKTDGSIWAMGHNSRGQLGLGDTTRRFSPVQVVASGFAQVATGHSHSLFRKTDGSLFAVGRNNYGQLGDETYIDRTSSVPVVASDVTDVATGGSSSIFIKTGGSLWQMLPNEDGDGGTPTQIVAADVTQIAAGSNHILFVKTDGSLWGWGQNSLGQLGDGTTTYRADPVQILASGVAKVAAGFTFSHFIKTDGSLWSMGYNFAGQLGDGTTIIRTSPVRTSVSGVDKVAAGNMFSVYLF